MTSDLRTLYQDVIVDEASFRGNEWRIAMGRLP
jgi:hypothetical protein